MIEYENGVFSLKTDEFSYLFRVLPDGQLEHLHFGLLLTAEDVQALACKPVLGWGDCVKYGSSGRCLDETMLEWSGSGRGDYRESPVSLSASGDPVQTDFLFDSYEIFPGDCPFSLPHAEGSDGTLRVTLVHRAGGLRLHLIYSLFGGILTRRAVLENTGSEPLLIHKLMSFSLDLPGSFAMHSFTGGWIAEMRKTVVPVTASRVVNESTTGFSSNRCNPGFLLASPDATETSGTVYGFNLVYSGCHYASAQQSLQGLTRVMQGVSPADFHYPLPAGASFETPEAVLAFSDGGFSLLSERMHRFVNSHIVPKAWRFRERPVLYNSWEGCGFSFRESGLLDLARRAKKLGCELFVLDDGWFGDRNDDTAGLGDYRVNRKKLPGGISGLAKAVRSLGMSFGLWFEPEAVNPDSDLCRAHPDWALCDPTLPKLLGRNELLLDLTRPEVRDYIVASVSGILDSAPITYVKWDMNRHSPALGAKAHDYILGLYEVLHRIFDPRPDILLEGCASGGARFDLGMLCFAPQIWASDDTDPIERLTIQRNLSYLYPQSCVGAHVSAAPHAQTLRHTPLSTRGNVASFGCLGYELDLRDLLPTEEAEIREQIAFYKANRRVFQFGSFRRNEAEKDAESWSVTDGGTTVAGLFHRLIPAAPPYERLILRFLKKDSRYRAVSRKQSVRIGGFGPLLKHITPIRLNPNGAVLRTADRFYSMQDVSEDYTATGAAFASGVQLPSRFTGTGYNKSLRLQGDFGSNLYLIKEETEDEFTQSEK